MTILIFIITMVDSINTIASASPANTLKGFNISSFNSANSSIMNNIGLASMPSQFESAQQQQLNMASDAMTMPSENNNSLFDGFMHYVGPFINEIAVILNGSFMEGLYDHHHPKPHNKIIDFAALASILYDALRDGKEHGMISGFSNGVGLLIFSFLLPSPIINGVQKGILKLFKATKNPSKMARFAAALPGLLVLEGAVKLWEKYITPRVQEFFNK